MNGKAKLCVLILDEIALNPSINYDSPTDRIVGRENNQIVDHALVYIVKGIDRKMMNKMRFTIETAILRFPGDCSSVFKFETRYKFSPVQPVKSSPFQCSENLISEC